MNTKLKDSSILFISDNFPPESNAPATRTYEHCKVWVKKGYSVTVVTCNPNFPFGKIFKGYKNNIISKEEINGIKIIRLWSLVFPNKGFTLRVLDFLSFAIIASCYSLFRSEKIIITTSPQFFVNICGLVNKVLRKKRWIMEVRDIWPESISAVGSMGNDSLVFKLLEKLEVVFYNWSDLIIVVTNSFKKQLQNKTNTQIEVIKNASNPLEFHPDIKAEPSILKYKKDKVLVGYIGTLGLAHNLEFIIKNANDEELQNKFNFVIIGTGARRDNLKKLITRLGCKNVFLIPPIPKEDVPKALKSIDIGIIHLIPNKTFKSVIPSKLFDYGAAHVKILNGVLGETAEIISNYGIGYNYDPLSSMDFKKNLLKLSNQNIHADKFRSFIDENNREYNAEQMLIYIDKLAF